MSKVASWMESNGYHLTSLNDDPEQVFYRQDTDSLVDVSTATFFYNQHIAAQKELLERVENRMRGFTIDQSGMFAIIKVIRKIRL